MSLLVISACTGSSDAPTESPAQTSAAEPTAPLTTDTTVGPTTTQTTTTTTLDPVLAAALPIDPAVLTGTLGNGLRYYIRFNDSPGRRAELRLVVDAGSLFEADDQSGVAHFLEHMMFNGTERFPRNELIAVLESFGPRFGPDINAFTAFDETVYSLSLPSEGELLDLGILVLRQWATEATLTETDVVEERGVVLEEWRLRDQGLAGRINQVVEELLMSGTPYEGRAPIGTAEAIQAMTPDVLRQFYRDWYRPERMALIAVGDFDVEEMEVRLLEAFGDMEAVGEPRPPASNDWTPTAEVQAASLADPEVAFASVNVLWSVSFLSPQTVGDLQNAMAQAVAMDMVATRLNDDALRGTAPFLRAQTTPTQLTRTIVLTGLAVDARPDETPDALAALVKELARVRTHGFSDQEFQRAIDRLAADVEQIHENQGSTQDLRFADAILTHHLESATLMSADQRFEIETGVLGRLTKDDVEEAFLDFLDMTAPYVVAVGPDDADPPVPDAADIEAMFEAMTTLAVEPREETPTLESLMTPPEPADLSTVVIDETLGFGTLLFENGARVQLWPTVIADNVVIVEIASFGGSSVVPVEDVPEAELISEIVARSGLGPADAATLQEFLSERIVGVSPYISETREGITGAAATEDIEVMLQMIHLLMTAPRADQVAVDAVLDSAFALDASREDLPDLAIRDQLVDAYYSGDRRYFTVPSAEQLADFDADRALEIYRERFGNASDFVFAFVGDFDISVMIDLTSRYIGTLPGSAEVEQYTDNQPFPPRLIQLRTVEVGTDPQGVVRMYFTNKLDSTAKDRLTGRVLELIVNARLRDRIREQLSATYSPVARVDLQREPDPFVEAQIEVTGDPNRLDEIAAEVLADLTDLRANGPTEAEFATALQQLRTEMDLIDNLELAEVLVTSILYPDQPVMELVDRFTLVEEITAGDVRRLARITYAQDQRIEIRLIPKAAA